MLADAGGALIRKEQGKEKKISHKEHKEHKKELALFSFVNFVFFVANPSFLLRWISA